VQPMHMQMNPAGGILGLGCAYLGLRLTGFRETH